MGQQQRHHISIGLGTKVYNILSAVCCTEVGKHITTSIRGNKAPSVLGDSEWVVFYSVGIRK